MPDTDPAMKTIEAVKHPMFRTQTGLATALGLAQSTVGEWRDSPPHLHQLRIEAMTNGELRADEESTAKYPEFARYIRKGRKRTAAA